MWMSKPGMSKLYSVQYWGIMTIQTFFIALEPTTGIIACGLFDVQESQKTCHSELQYWLMLGQRSVAESLGKVTWWWRAGFAASAFSFPVIPTWLGIGQSSTCLADFSRRECSPTICITKWLSTSNFLIACKADQVSENTTNCLQGFWYTSM